MGVGELLDIKQAPVKFYYLHYDRKLIYQIPIYACAS